MVIYCDTRQQAGKHDQKHNQMKSLGCVLKRKKLDVGDYMMEGNNNISVDTKQDLQELYGNLVNDKSRFMREVRRAHVSQVKLIVLIEQDGYFTIDDIKTYAPKYGFLPGAELASRMRRIQMAYGVIFLFCSKATSGLKIVELLQNSENKGGRL